MEMKNCIIVVTTPGMARTLECVAEEECKWLSEGIKVGTIFTSGGRSAVREED